MAYYVYIIKSALDQSYYKGFTENPIQRLCSHNNGESKYTSTKIPWMFVYIEELPTKKIALQRERLLKSYSHRQILSLVNSPRNRVREFI